jgi:hypothetical protein
LQVLELPHMTSHSEPSTQLSSQLAEAWHVKLQLAPLHTAVQSLIPVHVLVHCWFCCWLPSQSRSLVSSSAQLPLPSIAIGGEVLPPLPLLPALPPFGSLPPLPPAGPVPAPGSVPPEALPLEPG